MVKPFVGTWKNKAGYPGDAVSLDVRPDHTFQCTGVNTNDLRFNMQNAAGNYWVFPTRAKSEIMFLKGGMAWVHGWIDSTDGTLGIGGGDEGPSGTLEKVQ